MLSQRGRHRGGQRDRPPALLGLGLHEPQAVPGRVLEGQLDGQLPGRQFHVLPVQARHLALAQAAVKRRQVKRFEPVTGRGVEERPRLVGRQRRHLEAGRAGRLHEGADVASQQPPFDGLVERLSQDAVRVLDAAGRQPGARQPFKQASMSAGVSFWSFFLPSRGPGGRPASADGRRRDGAGEFDQGRAVGDPEPLPPVPGPVEAQLRDEFGPVILQVAADPGQRLGLGRVGLDQVAADEIPELVHGQSSSMGQTRPTRASTVSGSPQRVQCPPAPVDS